MGNAAGLSGQGSALNPISNLNLPESGCQVPALAVAVDLPWPSPAPAAEHELRVVRRVSSSSKCRGGAGQGTWCQVRISTSVEIPEYLEWSWKAIAQDAVNKRVTRVKNTIWQGTQEVAADAGCHVRPQEFAVAFLCSNPAPEQGQVRGRGLVRRVSSSASGCRGAGQETWCQVRVLTSVVSPGSATAPVSGCGFVLEDIGRELLMTKDCPEFGGGKAKCETLKFGKTRTAPYPPAPNSNMRRWRR